MKNTNTLPKSPRSRALHCVLLAAATASFIGTAAMAGEAQLSVANVSVPEGNSGTTQMNFSVVRSGDSSTNITVPYSVPPGTAKANEDYQRPANNTVLRIPAGFTQGIISVPVNGDTKVEPNETLQLQLGQPAAYTPQPAFAETPAYIFDGLPYGSVAADFNGDGVLDLATADLSDDFVSIMLGDGSGRFGKAREFPAGKAKAVTSADFNRDGKPDLAIPNYEANTVSILLGDGRGRFGAPANYAAGVRPDAIATADFNGDGRPDLVVVNEGDGSTESNVSVFLGNGSGTLGSALTFKVGIDPRAIAIADLTGDGVLDLAVANYNSRDISLLTGKGNGKFRAATSLDGGDRPGSVTTGDFNGDGRTDLAETNFAGTRILLGLGAGNFASPLDIAVGAGSLTVIAADFGQDGKLDLAVAGRDTNNVSILVGDGSGGFAAGRTFHMTEPPNAAVIADFNGDGRPDLAVSTSKRSITIDNTVSILLGTGDNNFAATESYVVGPYATYMASADFNQDGHPDLAVSTSYGGGISILLGTANAELILAGHVVGIGPNTLRVATADFNNDGKADLVVTTSGAAGTNLLILLGDGSGGFGTPIPLSFGSCVFALAADFNGDGSTDIACAGNGAIAILLGNGHAGFAPAVNYAISGFYVDPELAAADLNGDGRLDLIAPIRSRRRDYDQLAVLLGDGGGGFGPPSTIFLGTHSSERFAVGDLNGDGIPDLAVERYDSNNLDVLIGDGTGGFGAPRSFSTDRGGIVPGGNVAIVDFNGDGARDIGLTTTSNLTDGTIAILVNDGSGNFGAPVTINSVNLQALLAVDLNGDGKRDIAVTNGQNGTVEVFFSSPDSTAVLSNSSATGTILNDD